MKKLALLLTLLVIPTTILISMEYNQALQKIDENLLKQARLAATQDASLGWVYNKINASLKNHPSINVQDDLGNTRLHYAAFLGSGPLLIDLLNAGGDASLRNTHDQDIASIIEYLLLTFDTKLNELSRKLQDASKKLSKQRFDGYKSEYDEFKAGYTKLRLEYQKVLRVLAKNNVSITLKDNETLLHKAVRLNDELLIIDLLKHLDPNAQNNERKTPLQLALSGTPHEVILEQLLIHDANPNLQDHNGNTALHMAAIHAGEHPKIINQLLRNGAKVDLKNNHHENAVLALLHSIQDEAKVYVYEKRKMGAHSYRMNQLQEKQKILNKSLEIIQGQIATLFTLLNTSHDKNIQDDFGNTPLYYLTLLVDNPMPIRTVVMPIIKQFLPQFNVNVQTKEGFTPLHAAVNAYDLEMVQLLLQNGANPRIQASASKTNALELAQKLLLTADDSHKQAATSIVKVLTEAFDKHTDIVQSPSPELNHEMVANELFELALSLQQVALSMQNVGLSAEGNL